MDADSTKKMISVIIPLYNKQESITATLQSVLAQTYTDYEIIVVDDGSTDNSVARVEQLMKDSDQAAQKIRLISKSNGGVSSARNEGIRRTKYNYVAFLDADDCWEPNYLHTQAALIHDFPKAKMWGTAWGMQYGIRKEEGKGVRIGANHRGYVEDYFLHNMFLFYTCVVVIDKRIFAEIDMFDERISCGEDVDLWWRIILHYPVAYENKCLVYYRQDAENRITLSHPPLNKHFVYYIEKYASYYVAHPDFKRYVQHEILGHLYKYYLLNPHNPEIKRILGQIDFSLQPVSYRFRYTLPNLYNFLIRFKS